MHAIRLKRAYERPDPEDGLRVLADRLWPRGLSKERAAIDHWAKEAAPSDELRRWFGRDPARWEAFQARYREELQSPQAQEEIAALRALSRKSRVTLLYAARDAARNNAVALRDFCVPPDGVLDPSAFAQRADSRRGRRAGMCEPTPPSPA